MIVLLFGWFQLKLLERGRNKIVNIALLRVCVKSVDPVLMSLAGFWHVDCG